jgi:tetratricopeptide (TPR) repeat protein
MKKLIIISIFGVLLSCADKKSSTDNLNLAIEEINKKAYENAFTYIKLAFNKDSSSPSILYYKGLIEANLKKNSEALISFQKAISLDSTNYKALVERAKLKITLGDIVSAVNDCDRARLVKKDYTEIYLTKAHAYERMNDNSNAIVQYECAIQYGEKTGETYFKIGLLNLNAGKKEIACDYLRKAGDLGFMESFELIKANCNTEDDVKQNKSKEPTPKIVSKNSDGKAPSIKIGDSFQGWENDFTVKGISSKTGLHSYLYNKSITTLICEHQVDKLIVNTKNNKVVTFIYLLLPKSDDTGVPGCLIKKLQKQVGAQMVFKNGKYGASDGNIIVSLFRADDPTFGRDRIYIYTTTND